MATNRWNVANCVSQKWNRSNNKGFALMPVEHATMRVHLPFFARGLVTLLLFLAKDQVSRWARLNIDEIHFQFYQIWESRFMHFQMHNPINLH